MTGDWPTQEVDHINRNKTDNRWYNLRDVPRSVNQKNRTNLGGKTKKSYKLKHNLV